ncbi:MAG: paraquat-inducible protein A [Pseudomonadota bacterium]
MAEQTDLSKQSDNLRFALKLINVWLIVAFPFSWFAPLLRAGILPFFSLSEISVWSGLMDLLESDIFLALVVALFAMVIPMVKALATALLQFAVIAPRNIVWISVLGKFAMAEVFLLALYIVVAKGVGVGRLETGWGLYFFTFCVLVSYIVTVIEGKMRQP